MSSDQPPCSLSTLVEIPQHRHTYSWCLVTGRMGRQGMERPLPVAEHHGGRAFVGAPFRTIVPHMWTSGYQHNVVTPEPADQSAYKFRCQHTQVQFTSTGIWNLQCHNKLQACQATGIGSQVNVTDCMQKPLRITFKPIACCCPVCSQGALLTRTPNNKRLHSVRALLLFGAVWPAGMLAAAAQDFIASQGGTLVGWNLAGSLPFPAGSRAP